MRQASSPDLRRRCVVAADGRVLKTSSRKRRSRASTSLLLSSPSKGDSVGPSPVDADTSTNNNEVFGVNDQQAPCHHLGARRWFVAVTEVEARHAAWRKRMAAAAMGVAAASSAAETGSFNIRSLPSVFSFQWECDVFRFSVPAMQQRRWAVAWPEEVPRQRSASSP
nr:hypothetical protein Iba_chr12cCG13630 [Ipomoea batatas]